MDVASIMSSGPICVALDTAVNAARELMDSESIRHLPVVAHDRVIGVVSDRDLYPTESESAGTASRTIADILQDRLSTLSPHDSLLTASARCLEQEDGCLPVVGERRLAGILSEMDLVMALMRAGQASSDADGRYQLPSEDLMTPFPVEATPETTVSRAIGLCRTLRAHHLPVVSGETLAGIVSDRDLLRCAVAGRATETTLAEIMERDPLTIPPGHPAHESAALMATAKVSALPVIDDGQLVGILTLTDLIKHFMHTLKQTEARGTP